MLLKKLWLLSFLLLFIKISAQEKMEKIDVDIQSKPNVLSINPIFTGYFGLGFRFNYERNLNPRLIGLVSLETLPKYYYSAGIGMKYRSFNEGKLENLIGLSLNKNFYDNSRLKLPSSSAWILKTSSEFRYKINKQFFLSGEVNLGYNFSTNKLYPGFGLGAGIRF